jgi:hypothetical protein
MLRWFSSFQLLLYASHVACPHAVGPLSYLTFQIISTFSNISWKNSSRLCLKIFLLTTVTSSLSFYSYQKDKRTLSGYILTRCSFSSNPDTKRFPPAPPISLAYFKKIKVGLSDLQPVCVCVCVCVSVCLCVCVFPTNNFWIDGWIFVKFDTQLLPFKWPRRHIFNLVVSAITKWRTFKLLRWV